MRLWWDGATCRLRERNKPCVCVFVSVSRGMAKRNKLFSLIHYISQPELIFHMALVSNGFKPFTKLWFYLSISPPPCVSFERIDPPWIRFPHSYRTTWGTHEIGRSGDNGVQNCSIFIKALERSCRWTLVKNPRNICGFTCGIMSTHNAIM